MQMQNGFVRIREGGDRVCSLCFDSRHYTVPPDPVAFRHAVVDWVEDTIAATVASHGGPLLDVEVDLQGFDSHVVDIGEIGLLIKALQKAVVDKLRTCRIHNATPKFLMVWRIVALFIDPRTISKVEFANSALSGLKKQ
jgi:hypothetical protein